MSLKSRIAKLEQASGAECRCAPLNGCDVIHEGLDGKAKARSDGTRSIRAGAPAPPPRMCADCGRPRTQIVVRYQSVNVSGTAFPTLD
jgi:hypothetical protein